MKHPAKWQPMVDRGLPKRTAVVCPSIKIEAYYEEVLRLYSQEDFGIWIVTIFDIIIEPLEWGGVARYM